MLCAIAAYFIKDYLANPPMVIFVYPVLLLFSVLAQYFFMHGEFYSPKKLDQWLMWTILASIAGNVIGIGSGRLDRHAAGSLEPRRACRAGGRRRLA